MSLDQSLEGFAVPGLVLSGGAAEVLPHLFSLVGECFHSAIINGRKPGCHFAAVWSVTLFRHIPAAVIEAEKTFILNAIKGVCSPAGSPMNGDHTIHTTA